MRALVLFALSIITIIALAVALPLPAHSAAAQSAPLAQAAPSSDLPDDTITPFDCGSGFCVLPKGGLYNLLRTLNTIGRENARLNAELVEAKKAKPVKCGIVERVN